MSNNKIRKDEGPRRIRFRGVFEATSSSLGLPGELHPVLVGWDDFGHVWVLAANPKGAGWMQIVETELPVWTKEDQAALEKKKEEAMAEAQRIRDEELAKPDLVVGGDAINMLNQLPKEPGA